MSNPLRSAEEQAVLATMKAPKFVQTTASLLFVYVVLVFVNALVFAFITRHWVLAFGGLLQLSLGFSLMGSLFQLKKWAWWAVVLGGLFLSLRGSVGVLADVARLIRHLPNPSPQVMAVHLLGVLLILPIVVRMLMRPSRVAFGLTRSPADTLPEQQPQAGVWPPPPTV